MYRDPLPLTLPASDDAIVSATGALAAITHAHSLSATERERLDSSYNAVGKFLSEHPFFRPLTREVHPQGSMAIGTTTKPEGKAEFDVDGVVRLDPAAARSSPVSLLEELDSALQEYAERYDLKVKPKRRCTQLQYANAMHTDMTPVIDRPSNVELHGELAGVVPDRERREHLGTNPRGYVKFFNDVAKAAPRFTTMESRDLVAKADVLPLPGPQAWHKPLAQYVQLFKIHRNIQFAEHPELSPTSTFLTTQVALAYHALVKPGVVFQSPLHLLLALWKKMPEFVGIHHDGVRETWFLCNPTQTKENIADRMNSGGRQQAYREWRYRFARDVVALAQMYVPSGAGLREIVQAVEGGFGRRSSRSLTESYAASAQQERASGLARILVPAGGALAPAVAVASRNHTFFGGR